MQFKQVKTLKVNITSSLDLQPTYDKFGLMTRQLAKNSSKYVYRLQIYDFNKLQKIKSTDVYQSYDESKHFIKFISDRNYVAITTKFQIKFYKIDSLEVAKQQPHGQQNLYDLCVSFDGQLITLVGQKINVWRTNGFRKILFPHIIASAKYCSFSVDNKYMAIATNMEINIYLFNKMAGEYQFIQVTSVEAPTNNHDITAIDFNPTDSNQMVVGFLNVSPQLFKVDTGTFTAMKDIQPLATGNAKKVFFMPDGKRFLSSDYKNGIGIWQGIKQTLFYNQNLLYDLNPNINGSRFIGYVWQQVKVIDIQVQCKPQIFKNQCQCLGDQAWNYPTYSCKLLTCTQVQFSTKQIKNNQCVCIKGYKFNEALRKCVINCQQIQNAVNINSNLNSCYCKTNYSWNQSIKECQFNCFLVPYSSGIPKPNQQCECKPSFQWNQNFKECVCPKYSKPLNDKCVCFNNYFQNDQGKCILDCTKISNSNGSLPSQQQCQCIQGYYFIQINQVVGCKLNCTNIKHTQKLDIDFNNCTCIQNMNWDKINRKCKIDCNSVGYASGLSTLKQNTCNCAVNYLWIDQINQCGRNCTGISFVDQTKKSTLRSCPCIQKFNWDAQKKICQIDCTLINNTSPYPLANPSACQCRDSFDWINKQFVCRIDCKKIWDASNRIEDDSCACNKDKKFNKTSMTCNVVSQTPLFSSVWMIVAFVVCAVIILLIVIVLIKYCWHFKTQNNRQHAKRLKTNDNFDKKKKSKKVLLNLQQNNLLSAERLKIKPIL